MKKVMTFQYMKSPDDITDRVFLSLGEPTNKYFGVDIGELSEEEQGLFISGVNKAFEEYTEQLNTLMQEFDIKNNYRYFIPEKMVNVKVDE